MMTAGVARARRVGPDAERKREYEPSLMGMREALSPCDQEFNVTVDMMGGLGGQSFIAASSYQRFQLPPSLTWVLTSVGFLGVSSKSPEL